jgi:hypothetical protein
MAARKTGVVGKSPGMITPSAGHPGTKNPGAERGEAREKNKPDDDLVAEARPPILNRVSGAATGVLYWAGVTDEKMALAGADEAPFDFALIQDW